MEKTYNLPWLDRVMKDPATIRVPGHYEPDMDMTVHLDIPESDNSSVFAIEFDDFYRNVEHGELEYYRCLLGVA